MSADNRRQKQSPINTSPFVVSDDTVGFLFSGIDYTFGKLSEFLGDEHENQVQVPVLQDLKRTESKETLLTTRTNAKPSVTSVSISPTLSTIKRHGATPDMESQLKPLALSFVEEFETAMTRDECSTKPLISEQYKKRNKSSIKKRIFSRLFDRKKSMKTWTKLDEDTSIGTRYTGMSEGNELLFQLSEELSEPSLSAARDALSLSIGSSDMLAVSDENGKDTPDSFAETFSDVQSQDYTESGRDSVFELKIESTGPCMDPCGIRMALCMENMLLGGDKSSTEILNQLRKKNRMIQKMNERLYAKGSLGQSFLNSISTSALDTDQGTFYIDDEETEASNYFLSRLDRIDMDLSWAVPKLQAIVEDAKIAGEKFEMAMKAPLAINKKYVPEKKGRQMKRVGTASIGERSSHGRSVDEGNAASAFTNSYSQDTSWHEFDPVQSTACPHENTMVSCNSYRSSQRKCFEQENVLRETTTLNSIHKQPNDNGERVSMKYRPLRLKESWMEKLDEANDDFSVVLETMDRYEI